MRGAYPVRSDDDDAAPLGERSPAKCVEHLAAVQRQEPSELLAILFEEPAIRGRVGHDEQDDVYGPVALLECQPPFECLDVSKPRLAFAPRAMAGMDRYRVPRSSISRDRHRHLGAPSGFRWQSPSETLQQCEVRGIACRIAVREGPDDQLQTDGCGRA